MGCEPKLALMVIGGFVSGVLLGFVFRFSEAERDQAFRSGYRSGFLQRLHLTPIWRPEALLFLIPALGLMAFVLWAPGALLGILPLCGPDFKMHKVALIVGALFGAVLRWLLWKHYLQYK